MILDLASSKLGSVGVNSGVPIKKCRGIKGSKFVGSSFEGLNEREFKELSMRDNRVASSSKVNFWV